MARRDSHLLYRRRYDERWCLRTANAATLPVWASPVEATALGNLLVRARAHGAMPALLEATCIQLARAVDPNRSEPS